MVSVALVALLTAATPAGPPQAAEVCVVAHLPGGMEAPSTDVDLVRRIFLVRQRFWADGTPTRPVNLPASSPVRERFTRAVFGQGVRDMAPYWNDRYFHGTRPPPTVASTEALLLFLERTEGSVGYLADSDAAALPAGLQRLFCLPGEGGGGGPAGS